MEKILDLKSLVQRSLKVLKQPLNQKKGFVDQEEVQKHYRASIYMTFWIRKGWRWKNYDELWWTMKNTQELGNPNADLRNKGKKTYGCRSTAEVAAVSLIGSGWCGGQGRRRRGALRRRRNSSGSRVAKGRRRGKGRMRKYLVMPIYKGRLISGREKRGGRKHDYPTTETPRFSGWLLR